MRKLPLLREKSRAAAVRFSEQGPYIDLAWLKPDTFVQIEDADGRSWWPAANTNTRVEGPYIIGAVALSTNSGIMLPAKIPYLLRIVRPDAPWGPIVSVKQVYLGDKLTPCFE